MLIQIMKKYGAKLNSYSFKSFHSPSKQCLVVCISSSSRVDVAMKMSLRKYWILFEMFIIWIRTLPFSVPFIYPLFSFYSAQWSNFNVVHC